MVSKGLKWFLVSQNLLADEQAGFRNQSTPNSLMRFVQDVKQEFNQENSTLAVLTDFKVLTTRSGEAS